MRKEVEWDEEGGGPSAWSGRGEDSFGEMPGMYPRLYAATAIATCCNCRNWPSRQVEGSKLRGGRGEVVQ